MPDPTPLQPSFWDNEEGALWSVLVSTFVETMMDGFQGGIDLLPPNIAVLIDFDVVNQAALDYARRYRYEWIKSIMETTRAQVQQAISDWIQSGAPLPDLQATLTPIFGPMRAEMIAVTEVTRVYQEANVASWESTGFVDEVNYRTAKDDKVCPICSPLDGKTLPIKDTTDHPPKHVRCRCFTVPVVSIEAVNRQLERVLNV
jgi:SPP1 gp7 family putative phage head morphogenesis protein